MKPNLSTIRAQLRKHYGDRKYRITASGHIHVYGTLPNTNIVGWYLFGEVRDPITLERITQL